MKHFFKRLMYYILVGMAFFVLSSFLYVLYLRWCPPLTTPLMLVRAMEGPYRENGAFNYRCKWKGYNQISPQLEVAVIAAEDQQFAFHHGLDYEAIWDAFKYNWKSNKVRGGSTISQQVAKNVFLWQGRTYLRKSLEVYFTWMIELLWSKKRILEMYLNVIEMGDGIFGSEAAAKAYFKKPALDINNHEAALLAAILPNPRRFSAVQPSGYILAKTRNIERFMRMIKGKAYLKNLE
jgi:monofunctional biosynthetic peptidoglycan transglycosylase